MKNEYTILHKVAYALFVPALLLACNGDDEDPVKADVDFLTISSAYDEANGTGTVTVPLRGNASAADLSFEFDGTAVEGEDYEVLGVTGEGFQVTILDDNDAEPIETIRVRMVSPSLNLSGNAVHTIYINSNCEDTDASAMSFFPGRWNATEKYGATPDDWYGPYEVLLTQDDENPNMLHFDNLYDSGCEAYMVFDLEAGTVYFPDQAPCDVALTNSSGTFTMGPCANELTINLNFDGGDWVYSFSKIQ